LFRFLLNYWLTRFWIGINIPENDKLRVLSSNGKDVMAVANKGKPFIVVVSQDGILGTIVNSCQEVDLAAHLYIIDNSEDLAGDFLVMIGKRGRPELIVVESFNESEMIDIKNNLINIPEIRGIPVVGIDIVSETDGSRILHLIQYVYGLKFNLPRRIWSGTDGKEMVLVPSGKYFRRGGLSQTYASTDNDGKIEGSTRAFYIDRYPVTNMEYRSFIEKSGYRMLPHWNNLSFPVGMDNHPVVGVNWQDVLAYADWAGKYIPSPDEWEKAAFGVSGAKFPWGDDFDIKYCNVKESNHGGTTPVGSYSPDGDSPFGVSDTIGNVWEWVYDWTASSDSRMLLGGAWDTPVIYLHSPFFARVHARPGLRGMNFGFRLAISPSAALILEDNDE
jgi:formylglycine-generating enzyme required for sulfatase activity